MRHDIRQQSQREDQEGWCVSRSRARRADGVPARFSPTSRRGRTLVRATVGDARGLPRAPGPGRARVRLDPRGVATRHARNARGRHRPFRSFPLPPSTTADDDASEPCLFSFSSFGVAAERANRASLQNDRAEKVAERGVRAVRQGDRHKLREDVQAAGTSLGGVRHRHRRDERGATNERLSVLRQTHARRVRANEIRRHRKGGGHVRPGGAGSRGAAEAQGGVPGARKAEPSREEGERREKRRRRRGGGRRRVQRGDDAAQRDSLRAGVAGYAFFSSRNPRASLLSAARRVPFLSYSPVAVR